LIITRENIKIDWSTMGAFSTSILF
jgi:hypothetical protein